MWYNRGCGHDFEKSRLSQARWLFRTAAPLVRTGAIFDNNHLLQKNVLCFQDFALCLLVSTTRVFLLIESASNLHGGARIKDGEVTNQSNFAQPRGDLPAREPSQQRGTLHSSYPCWKHGNVSQDKPRGFIPAAHLFGQP